jgi:hypothetical protein
LLGLNDGNKLGMNEGWNDIVGLIEGKDDGPKEGDFV